jgi:hypothetical protein
MDDAKETAFQRTIEKLQSDDEATRKAAVTTICDQVEMASTLPEAVPALFEEFQEHWRTRPELLRAVSMVATHFPDAVPSNVVETMAEILSRHRRLENHWLSGESVQAIAVAVRAIAKADPRRAEPAVYHVCHYMYGSDDETEAAAREAITRWLDAVVDRVEELDRLTYPSTV